MKAAAWNELIETLSHRFEADRRYSHVFAYHNGADSYYAARGFRGRLSL